MKKFLIYIFLFFLAVVVILEVFLSLSGFATDVQEQVYFSNDSMVLFKPYSEGRFTRGMRGEVSSHFRINKQGWNSILDYDSVPPRSLAIIGDSYIEGGYSDVENSLGRRVERLYPGITVHEYGMAGANFLDFNNIYKLIEGKGYKAIIVNMGPKDVLAKKPSFTQKDGFKLEKSKMLYRKSALLRYVNVNLQISRVIFGKADNLNSGSFDFDLISKKFNEMSKPGIIYMYEDMLFDSVQTSRKLLKINHYLNPHDYGFNGHWNDNGYNNVANSIVAYLKQIKF